MKFIAHAIVASGALWLSEAGGAGAACALPPAPQPIVVPGPAPNGNRLPIDAGPLVFALNGSAIYPVAGTDGLVHLAFSASVTNVTANAVTFASIETLDAATGAIFGETKAVSMSGADLSRKVFRFAAATGVADASFSGTLGPGEAGALYLDVAVAAGTRVPAHLALQLASTMATTSGAQIAFKTTGVAMPVSCDPSIVLSPPLKGTGWVDGNGCCRIVSPHRWVLIPARGTEQPAEQFAIDFVRLDASGRLYSGERTSLANWFGYRAEIVAAGAGSVVEVVDDLPNGVPGKDPPTVDAATAAGNHVIIDMGSNRYALYAHLDPGSILVKVGQRVETGELLARLGNSGNTDAPHLHFHVTDRPSALDATGVPFVFERMHLAGRAEGSGDGAVDSLMKGETLALDAAAAGERAGTMPLMLDVMDFR